ncbi:Sensor histidine kinase YehU [Lacunisphaera limnophila]|uniref:Sensor histidine kinase YehU n=1 Tax=Lacunisphaera limnophila TaxID=1838286 RepID=A0A1D8ASA9_9BACT|nr:histidine kinase [Lacunisphaera limnophila]AOS43784.1 Sensor histidine kinase YehU [Lacunisphaera limnophila]
MSARGWFGTWLRDWRIWGGLWLAGLLVLAGLLLWDARSWLAGAPDASFRATRLHQWPLSLLWWVLLPAVLWLQHRLTRLDRHWPWAIALHTLMAGLITGLFILLAAIRLLVANHLPWSFLPVILHDLRGVGRWDYTPLIIYFMGVTVLYAVGYHRQWRAGQLLTGELRVANARLETRLVRASLDALKMQLHPHFLFNTLNSITSLIRNDRTREAEDVVAGLGELLRRALEHRQEALDTLEHELEFLRRYFEIESIRFQDRLQVEYDIAPECLSALVPCLMLQPLAENAMKHGISRDPTARLLRISARRDQGRLELTVDNDGPPLPRDELVAATGIGVQNTRTRLHMLYGDEARFELRDQPPRGVRARLILPFTLPPAP